VEQLTKLSIGEQMALCEPGDKQAVEAAATEFIKLCDQHGLGPEQIIQAGVSVVTAAIGEEAEGDLEYALDLAERFMGSLKSAIRVDHGSVER
jgi:hypothetical protein